MSLIVKHGTSDYKIAVQKRTEREERGTGSGAGGRAACPRPHVSLAVEGSFEKLRIT